MGSQHARPLDESDSSPMTPTKYANINSDGQSVSKNYKNQEYFEKGGHSRTLQSKKVRLSEIIRLNYRQMQAKESHAR